MLGELGEGISVGALAPECCEEVLPGGAVGAERFEEQAEVAMIGSSGIDHIHDVDRTGSMSLRSALMYPSGRMAG